MEPSTSSQSATHIASTAASPVAPLVVRESAAKRVALYGIGIASFSIALVALSTWMVTGLGMLATLGWLATSEDPIADCRDADVVVIPIEGEITTERIGMDVEGNRYTSAVSFAERLNAAVEDDDIAGIVVYVNSPGGEVVPSMDLARVIEAAASTKPIVSYIDTMGDSGAYLAAIAADRVFVNELADVGNIGAIIAYLDETKYNDQEGYTYVEFKSAPYKSAGSPYRAVTPEEGAMFQEQIDQVHVRLVEHVARLRGMTVERAGALSDGSSWLGFRAVELGLADQVGTLDEAVAYVAGQALGEDIGVADATVCRVPSEADETLSTL